MKRLQLPPTLLITGLSVHVIYIYKTKILYSRFMGKSHEETKLYVHYLAYLNFVTNYAHGVYGYVQF